MDDEPTVTRIPGYYYQGHLYTSQGFEEVGDDLPRCELDLTNGEVCLMPLKANGLCNRERGHVEAEVDECRNTMCECF